MPYDGHNHSHGPHGDHHCSHFHGPSGYDPIRGGFIPNHFDWVDFNSESLNNKSMDSQSISKIHKILGYTLLIGGIILVGIVSVAILFL